MKLSILASDEKNRKVLELAKVHFEQQHRGVAVDIELLPREEIGMRIREGAPPDLIEWEGNPIKDLLDRGIVLDLADLLRGGAFEWSDFYPAVLETAMDQGRIGAIPVMAEVPGVFYNRLLFDQSGVAYPQADWTWEDLVKKTRVLNRYDRDGEVVRFGSYLVPRLLPVEPLVWSNGGAFLSEEGKASGYLDSPETADAIRRYIEMYHPLEVTPYQDLGSESWIACFMHQKMALYYDANWTIKPMRPEHREHFGVVMPPRLGERPYRNIMQVYGYGISSRTADAGLAGAFLQELASPRTQRLPESAAPPFPLRQRRI